AGIDFDFLSPSVSKIQSNAIGIDQSVLGIDFSLTVGVCRVVHCVHVIGEAGQRKALVFVESVDAGAHGIPVVASVSGGRSAEHAPATVGLCDDINSLFPFSVVKTAQFGLITLFIKDLYALYDFSG